MEYYVFIFDFSSINTKRRNGKFKLTYCDFGDIYNTFTYIDILHKIEKNKRIISSNF